MEEVMAAEFKVALDDTTNASKQQAQHVSDTSSNNNNLQPAPNTKVTVASVLAHLQSSTNNDNEVSEYILRNALQLIKDKEYHTCMQLLSHDDIKNRYNINQSLSDTRRAARVNAKLRESSNQSDQITGSLWQIIARQVSFPHIQ